MRRPRPRSSEDLDAVDVLLVDDDDEDVAADEVRAVLHELALEAMHWRATWPGEPERRLTDVVPLPPAEPGALLRRLADRYRRRALVAAALAVAVAATTAVVDARQTAARAVAFAAMPAVLLDASDPPVEVWRVPGRVASHQHHRLLVVDDGLLQAVDPATGEAIWTAAEAAGRAASAGGCFPLDESLEPDRAPLDAGPGPRGLVACGAARGGEESSRRPAGGADLVVLDAATGRTRHAVRPEGDLLLAQAVGRDLLVAAARPDGQVRVTRWDSATGTPRWDVLSGRPALTGEVADTGERRRDSLTVGSFTVDLTSGREVEPGVERRHPYPYGEQVLPGGARATWGWGQDGTFWRGRVSGGAATSSYLLPGPPLRAAVDDGSDRGVLVVQTADGDRLRGLRLRTGRMRWTQPSPTTSPLRAAAQVDGVLLVDDGTTVTAVDLGTGGTRWRSRVDPDATDAADRAALTDGEVVVLPLREDGVLHLVGHRVADGTVAWRSPAPPGTVAVTVVDHRLIASTGDGVIGLG